MWNDFQTADTLGVTAEITTFSGGAGDQIHAYVAHPMSEEPVAGIVLAHHMPGWDELYQEFAERLARHNYEVICPDLYCRAGHGTPDAVAAKVRSEGGVADRQVVADLAAARTWLRSRLDSNSKVAVMGSCSGGRHAVLTASLVPGFDAVVDLWGGAVVMTSDQLTDKRPVAPIEYAAQMHAPLLGIFGNEDRSPAPAEVDVHEATLREMGKDYEFHRYDGAGHGFFYYDSPRYRPEQAMDAWQKIWTFLDDRLIG